MKSWCVMAGLLLLSLPAYSADDPASSVIHNSSIETIRDDAREWHIDQTEWDRYLQLMNGPWGRYYKKLSPPEVLGIFAKNDVEMQQFAEIAARLEHDRLARELKFNAAFHAAAQKLYASEPPIRSFDITPFTPIPKHE